MWINGPALEDCSTFDTDGRVCPGHRGSSRGSPPIDPATIPVDADVAARRDKRRAYGRLSQGAGNGSVRGPGQVFLEVFLHPHLWGRNKCWKCSSKKGQAVEVVLGVSDPVADERSESEGSESDREEHTADRIAEKLGQPGNKKRGGRGRDRGHSRSEAAPKRGGRGAGAGGAAGLVAGVITVSMVPRSGGPGPRAPSALMPRQLPHIPQLPAVRPPLAGRSSGRRRDARARGSSVLRGLVEVIAYTWATTRVVRNRLMHILTDNGPSSVVYILSLALVAPVFWDVHKNSRIIVDEAMTTAAAAASAVIEEAGQRSCL